jgi:YHS domain-containing protein
VEQLIRCFFGGRNSPATPQTTCPITCSKIDKAIFADYQGERIYFCCAACPAVFTKDPAKYIKGLEDQGVVLDETPTPARSSAPAEK